jgi:succinate-acetate transporter protein
MTETAQPDTGERTLKDTTSNPAPLGLLGFGMTTVLLNIHNAGFTPLDSMIMGMGIWYGGLAQVIAGVMEWKKKNTFGAVAFTSYGFFWISLVTIWVFPKLGFAAAPTKPAMAGYLFLWGFFTLIMFLGTLKKNVALMFIFGSLVVLFALLGFRDALESKTIGTLAGYEGIVCGASAIYLAAAEILNEVYGKTILPICPIKK